MYPQFDKLIGSTAAARVNGYITGYGTGEDLRMVMPALGLSECAALRILELHRRLPVRCV
jgi:peptide-methionine (S)-S-oxide reductase